MSVSRERHWFERTANDIAVQRGFQLLAGTEVVRPKHLLDTAVESLRCPAVVCMQTMRGDHTIGLRVRRRGEAVLDAEGGLPSI